MKRQGFTLIELLAVIVILAIIAVIIVPIITNVIEDSRKGAFKSSVEGAYKAALIYSQMHGEDEVISITDEKVEIKNNNFKSGEFIKVENDYIIQNITDNKYCANGKLGSLSITKGNCMDEEGNVNIVAVVSNLLTSSLTVSAYTVEEPEIRSYQYSIDGNNWITSRDNNHTFTNLRNDEEYEVRVRLRTSDIEVPIYSIGTTNWTKETSLTISYPSVEGYTYGYSLDDGETWIDVLEEDITIAVRENGTIIGRVIDNVGNTKHSSFTVANIDNSAPSINIDPSEVTIEIGGSYNVMSGVTSSDEGSGVKTTIASITDTSGLEYGTHTITYTVTDHAGNEVQATRNITVTLGTDSSGASAPGLTSGMIPVVYNQDGKTVKATTNQIDWYNYDKKRWANVVLVSSSSRTTYQNASVGTEISENDILAYLVWVPRYRYQLFNVGAAQITPRIIEIEFENKTATKSIGSSNGSWLTHPAFTFGAQELDGIWVGKFETTGSATTPTIKPNITSLRNQNISSQFTTSQRFSNTATYGLVSSNDSHMMKNTEWGAMAYLTGSRYGKGTEEVWINPNSNYITGCAGNTASASETITCEEYYTVNGVKASTTGNMYGIYDTSGGAWERVMGYNNGTLGSSGFSSLPNSKYYDVYTSGTTFDNQAAFNRRILGDATGETRGWHGANSRFIYTSSPWFERGGRYPLGTTAEIYSFYSQPGAGAELYSFRIVILGE